MIFRTALLEILNNLARFYDHNNEPQIYITVIDDTINHGLNTGNYNVRTAQKRSLIEFLQCFIIS